MSPPCKGDGEYFPGQAGTTNYETKKTNKKGKVNIMKKNLKKFIALLVSVMMVLAIAVVANATENDQPEKKSYTIKIENGNGNPLKNEYTAYKVAGFTASETAGVYVDMVEIEQFKDFLNKQNIAQISQTGYDLRTLANNLASKINQNVPVAGTNIKSENGEATYTDEITVSDTGYYLVVETKHGDDLAIATKNMLVAVGIGENKVTLKTTAPYVKKKIVLESSDRNVEGHADNGTLVDSDVVKIGDTIKYQLETYIPECQKDLIKSGTEEKNKLTFQLKDTMSKGLDYVKDSVSIYITSIDESNKLKDADYDVIDSKSGDITVVKISLTPEAILANSGKTVFVTLQAKLNADANVGSTGNPNSVDLTYTNHWDVTGVPDDTHTTEEDTVITYTGILSIVKIDSELKDNKEQFLGDATFKIYDEEKGTVASKFVKVKKDDMIYYRPAKENEKGAIEELVTSEKDGKIQIYGLDRGDYWAEETKAPEGYNKATDRFKLHLEVSPKKESTHLLEKGEVDAPSEEKVTAEKAQNYFIKNHMVEWKQEIGNEETDRIINTRGLTLPGTGGIGTTLFTFGGLALVVLAVVMFFVYTRKQKKEA